MTKLQVTAQQRANAKFARDVMWPAVPPENVYPGLAYWRRPKGDVDCGTVACFGGWVAVNPHFQAQGVGSDRWGAPESGAEKWASLVARDLFGAGCLFAERQEDERGTDHEIVTKRLNKLIRNSVVKA